jgi:Tat protein translocase TatB subunit
MFGIGMMELLLILALALIFIGPKKMPVIARALGRGVREFRNAADDLKHNIDVDAQPTQSQNGEFTRPSCTPLKKQKGAEGGDSGE